MNRVELAFELRIQGESDKVVNSANIDLREALEDLLDEIGICDLPPEISYRAALYECETGKSYQISKGVIK